MPTTAQDLLYAGLRRAGVVISPGQTPNADKLADALGEANRMLGGWSCDPLTIHTRTIRQWTTAANTQSYTLGAGGDWDGPRPVRIERARVLVDDVPFPLDVIEGAEWLDRGIEISGIPARLYRDGVSPLSTVYLDPTPDAEYTVELLAREALARFAALDDEVELPDGYEDAIVLNLACRLGPMWGLAVDPDTRREAGLARAAIHANNARAPRFKRTAGGGRYDYRTGLCR